MIFVFWRCISPCKSISWKNAKFNLSSLFCRTNEKYNLCWETGQQCFLAGLIPDDLVCMQSVQFSRYLQSYPPLVALLLPYATVVSATEQWRVYSKEFVYAGIRYKFLSTNWTVSDVACGHRLLVDSHQIEELFSWLLFDSWWFLYLSVRVLPVFSLYFLSSFSYSSNFSFRLFYFVTLCSLFMLLLPLSAFFVHSFVWLKKIKAFTNPLMLFWFLISCQICRCDHSAIK